MKMTLRLTMSFTAALAVAALLPAQTSVPPDTPVGRCAAEYFRAFNAEDEAALKAFFDACFSEKALAQRPFQERLAMTRELQTQLGHLEPQKLVESSEERLVLLAKSEKGAWVEIFFLVDNSATGKLRGIRFQESEPPDPNEIVPQNLEELPKAVDSFLKKRTATDAFSGVVLIARGEGILFHEAYGLANRPFAVPVRKDTRFNLGSINKIFTKLAVAQLIEQGKLSLEDRLGKFLPDYPNKAAAEKVTVRQLLDHTSGIGDFFGEKFTATPKNLLRDNLDYLPLFASSPLLFEPGTSMRYSNGGYVLLGLIVEKVSGKSYYDYVREKIYSRAGMKDSDSYEADMPIPNLADGYTRSWDGKEHPGEAPRNNIYSRPARGSAAGGGYSTAEDLLRFVLTLKGGKLVSSEYTEWMLGGPEPATRSKKPPQKNMQPGLGIAGGAPGINAVVEMNGESTVIVLTNLDPPAAERVSSKVVRWLGALESTALLSSAPHFEPAGIKRKEAPIKDMKEALAKDNFNGYYAKNLMFHNCYIKPSGNNILLDVINTLKKRLYDFPRLKSYVKEWEEASIIEHEQMPALIAENKFEEAAGFIRDVHWSFKVQEKYIRKYYSLEK